MQDQTIIAFDESGNTGADLLEKIQPIFVLASVKFTIAQATELRNIIQTQADELKFNRLKKSKKNQSQIISLLNNELISEETVQLALFHKEYCIWAHTVDRLIEPLTYKNGFDLYKDGLNITITNFLYYLTPVFCDKTIFEQYKRDFINLFQKRDQQFINQFYTTVQALIESSRNCDYVEILAPILESREIIKEILDNWDNNNFDSTLSGFINLVDYWGRKTDKKFHAYVDKSNALAHSKNLIDRVKNKYLIQQEIGTDRRTLQMPLKLIDMKFVDSKDNIVVQIADLIAGAANHYYRALANEKHRDEFSDRIGETKIVKLVYSPVWPHAAFTPEEQGTVYRGGINIVDSLTSLINEKIIGAD